MRRLRSSEGAEGEGVGMNVHSVKAVLIYKNIVHFHTSLVKLDGSKTFLTGMLYEHFGK